LTGWRIEEAESHKRVAQKKPMWSLTALIPGRAALRASERMVKSMKPGSVIVDLAAPGGNTR
jgi:NAD(P) transhydrogenase subunit alpha